MVSSRLSALDRAVALVIGGALILLLLILLRGDQVGLRVVGYSPLPDAENVPVRASITVKFDRPLAPEGIEGALSLTPLVAGTVRAEGDELTFVPATALDQGTVYTVHVAEGVRADNGRALLTPHQWEFRTGQPQVVFTNVDAAGMEQLMTAPLVPDSAALPVSPQPLSAITYGIWDYAVAPDGSRIVFAGLTEAGGADLWSVTPGSEPSLLLPCPQAACSTADFSPDGTLLAFSKRNVTEFAAPMVSPPRLWLLDIATGETAPVFDDSQRLGFEPRWSGDGEWLSYVSPDRIGVGVVNLEDGREAFYASSTGETGIWNPLRPELVISVLETITASNVSTATNQPVTWLRAIDVVGGAERLLSGNLVVEDNSPSFSPDGEWIAFRRKEFSGARASPGKQIWLMRADGSEQRPLTHAPEFDHGSVSWSPDRRFLLYHRFPLRGPEIVVSIMAYDLESNTERPLVATGQRPQWLP